ncbi:MAG: ROK family protein [Ignavibacteria bacterium]|jgi:glucokinase|nr:ROK family protein [Ignavibacteria bacterium]
MPEIKNYIAVVDLGGTKILAAILNKNAEIISLAKKSTKSKNKSETVFDRVILTIEEALSLKNLSPSNLDGIVLGIPGSLNPETGIVNLAPNLGLKKVDVIDPIKNHFNKEVFIENDANLGTLGIYHFESSENCKNLIAIFVGTGVGAGIIIDGKLYRGKNFSAGEIGHIKIKENGHKCGCGNYGCLETEASRTAITRIINEEIKKGKKSVIIKLTDDRKVIKSGILAQAIKKKDKVTIKAVQHAAEELGKTTGNLINMFDLDCVVFAGGVIEAIGSFMLPIIKEKAKETALKSNFKGTRISISHLKDNAALLGGFALFKNA